MNESKENQPNKRYVGYAVMVEDRQGEEQGSDLALPASGSSHSECH